MLSVSYAARKIMYEKQEVFGNEIEYPNKIKFLLTLFIFCLHKYETCTS